MTHHLLAATVLLAAGSAQAATMSVSDSLSDSTLNISGHTFSIQQFDTSLGTLTGVDITLGTTFKNTVQIENLSASNDTVLITHQADYWLGTQTGANVFSFSDTEQESIALAAFDGSIDFNGNSGAVVNRTVSGGMSGPVPLSDISVFNGTGTFNFSFNASQASSFSNSAAVITQLGGTAAAELTVTYTYDAVAAVPLPAGFVLLSASIAGLSAFRRKVRGRA